ncbi:transposase [Candidatus Bathyarchaeota archaeon]|nr:transposase [Candidatus Bathyarchaeota archaeon]
MLFSERKPAPLGAFYPSSKLCSNCGYKHDALELSDREWICAACGTQYDQDAKRVEELGIRRKMILLEDRNGTIITKSTVRTTGSHTSGDRGRPEAVEAPSTTKTAVVDEGRIHAISLVRA